MTRSRVFGCVSAFVASLVLATAAAAAPFSFLSLGSAGLSSSAIPVVVFLGGVGRATVSQFAAAHHDNPTVLRKDYAASGIVRCGLAHGAGQLTLSDDVITTAAHVFFDESGRVRARSCRFEVMRGDATVSVSVDMKSIVAGSRNPYAVSVVHDWAVARLDMPITDATPYQIADAQQPGAKVRFVARGHVDWGDARKLSLQDCRLRDQIKSGAEGTREFSFDCDTGNGSSGGALMTRDGVGKLFAVLVGYRSISPNSALPFSPLHYNFVVSVEGAFRAAAIAMAQPALASAPAAAPSNLVAANGVRPSGD